MSDDRVRLANVLETAAANAALGWALVALVLGVGVASLRAGDLAWAAFCLAVAAVALVPAVRYRDARA